MSEVNEAQLLLGQAIQLGTLIGCECNRLGIDICTRKCNESKVWDLIRQARTLIQGEQDFTKEDGDSVAPTYGVSLGHPYYDQLMDAYERGQKDGAAPCVEHVSRSVSDNELIALLDEVDALRGAATQGNIGYDLNEHVALIEDDREWGHSIVKVFGSPPRRDADGRFIEAAYNACLTLSAALRERPGEPRFMVHEPTMTVECNDDRCPLGSTMVGWPHLMQEGCMYAATTAMSGRCPAEGLLRSQASSMIFNVFGNADLYPPIVSRNLVTLQQRIVEALQIAHRASSLHHLLVRMK